jgi:4-hydroxybenzoate polyprenyltransferase
LVVALRPKQWTKNLIVFAGLIFGERLFDPTALGSAVVAFLVFCGLSSVVYLVNDVRDREADRHHPTKSRRPIAAGELGPSMAIAAAAVIAAAALVTAFSVTPAFGRISALYVAVLVLYSTTFKHVVILDVLILASGFVMRAWGGAAAVSVDVSHWLLLLALFGALFLALCKRRAELVALADDAKRHRPSLDEYSPQLLDQMISVVTASTLVAYALYTIDADTVARFGTDELIWTLPFPLYGIFRYLYLVHRRAGGGDPSEALLTDRPILMCVVLWMATTIALVYG